MNKQEFLERLKTTPDERAYKRAQQMAERFPEFYNCGSFEDFLRSPAIAPFYSEKTTQRLTKHCKDLRRARAMRPRVIGKMYEDWLFSAIRRYYKKHGPHDGHHSKKKELSD